MVADLAIRSGGRRTVLLAWELGGGLGHARRLLTIACGLERRGWAPVVAAREVWACAEEYRRAGIPILQAPRHRGLSAEESAHFRARSFADMLAACGYRGADELLPVVSAWDRLLDLLRPAVVVADYSPILSLAAYDRVPVVAIGDGFVLPPPHLSHLPRLRQHGAAMVEEHQLLANAAVVQQRRGRAAPRSLPALIGGAAHTVCTYPEIDIYRGHRLCPASGPVPASAGAGSPPTLARADKVAIFAYLAADFPPAVKLMQALINLRLPVEAFMRDIPEGMRRALRASGVHLHDAPPALGEVARRASLVVHHGGIGTIEVCLALGRPQLLLPRHFEQRLNAENLARLGTGVRLNLPFSLAEGSRLVAEAVSSERLAERAQEIAAGLAGREADSLERILAYCETLAGAA